MRLPSVCTDYPRNSMISEPWQPFYLFEGYRPESKLKYLPFKVHLNTPTAHNIINSVHQLPQTCRDS